MSEGDPKALDLQPLPVPQEFIHENPSQTSTAFGEPIQVGETIRPDDRYPGWSLTLFTFGNNQKDGCLFTVAPNTATPVGIVGRPPQEETTSGTKPSFTERIIKGSGTLLIQSPDGVVQRIPVAAVNPIMFQYGEGTRVAYIAGPEGLTGLNVGEPAGIPEPVLDHGDTQASQELWRIYDELTDNNSSGAAN